MSLSKFLICVASVALVAAPAWAGADLTFTLDSLTGTGVAPASALSPGTPCLPPGCVVFTGTLTDNDDDGSYMSLDTSLTFENLSPYLSVDETWDTVPGLLFGDNDPSSTPSDYFYGAGDCIIISSVSSNCPIFGIDIAPGTPIGVYTFNVQITGVITAADGSQSPDEVLRRSTT